METTHSKSQRYLNIAFIPLAIGINLGISAIVQVLKLPIFIDSVGTILAAILLGYRSGAIVGVLSFAITSITIFPPAIYFSLTQVAIAVYIYLTGLAGTFRSPAKAVLCGLGLAILAALVSAPVIYYLFGGITGNGISIFTLYLQAQGISKGASVIISGISAETIDKVSQCLIAYFIILGIPKSLLRKFNSQVLAKNNLI